MEKHKKIIWILHAGLGHKSPYFYNLINELRNYNNYNIITKGDMPNQKTQNGVVYFNRLKRYYDNNDITSIQKFINNIDAVKNNGWKTMITIHNFFPIDRKMNENDEYCLKEVLKRMDIIFTITPFMKISLEKKLHFKSVSHSIGINSLNEFNVKVKIPKFSRNDFIFTFIGNIYEYKMLNSVIRAFNSLNNKNVYLIIAGPSNDKFNLVYENKANIIRIDEFIGENAWKEISRITDIFINTYNIKEPFFKYGFYPSNCIQIMKENKICIVPKSKVIEEILPKGFYYAYDSEKSLCELMKKVLKKKKEIVNKEKKYPRNLYKKYSWASTAKIIIDTMEDKFKW